jgi:hypothetical protein
MVFVMRRSFRESQAFLIVFVDLDGAPADKAADRRGGP